MFLDQRVRHAASIVTPDACCWVPLATAELIIAETGADMARLRTLGRLASWAGSAPATTSPPA